MLIADETLAGLCIEFLNQTVQLPYFLVWGQRCTGKWLCAEGNGVPMALWLPSSWLENVGDHWTRISPYKISGCDGQYNAAATFRTRYFGVCVYPLFRDGKIYYAEFSGSGKSKRKAIRCLRWNVRYLWYERIWRTLGS